MTDEAGASGTPGRGRRLLWRAFLMIGIPSIVITIAISIYLSGGRYVSTDNAYVKSDIVQISTNFEGLITRVHVDENQVVAKGDRLFSVDSRLFDKELAVAIADVAAAVQQIVALRSRYQEGQSAAVAAEERVRYLKSEQERQRELLKKGLGTRAVLLARGERLDWLQSPEIVMEMLAAGILLYLFAVHTRYANNPFVARELFLNWNFMLGLMFVFLVGCVLYLPMILLPLQLEQLGGYPPAAVGELMMARGVGTVLSLTLMSRIRDRVDLRWLMLVGLIITGGAIWSMSLWSADVSPQLVIASNFMMGAATGSIWAPMNTMTLSHLPKRIQDQGFALFYLMFDVGNAIGTAVLIAMHTRHSQIGHALLSEHISPFRDVIRDNLIDGENWDRGSLQSLLGIEHEVTRQALAIAYNNSYLVASMVLAGMIPLVFLYRKPR